MISKQWGRGATTPTGYGAVFDAGEVTQYDEANRVFTVRLDGFGQVIARCGTAAILPDPDRRPRVLCIRTARMEWMILSEIPGAVNPDNPPLEEDFGVVTTDKSETKHVPTFRHETSPSLQDTESLEPRQPKGGDQMFLGRFGGLAGLFKSGAAILKSGFGCFQLMTKARRWIARARDFTVDLMGLRADVTTTDANDVNVTAVLQSSLSSAVPLVRAQSGALEAPTNAGAAASAVSPTPVERGIHIRLGSNVLFEFDADGNEVRVSFVGSTGTSQFRLNSQEATLFRGSQFISMTDEGVMIKGAKVGIAGPIHLFGEAASATITPVQGFPTGQGVATVSFTDETATVDVSTNARFRNSTTGIQEAAVLSSFLVEQAAALQAIAAHTHTANNTPSVELSGQLATPIGSAQARNNTSSPS